MKKLVSLFLVSALVIASLGGCAKQDVSKTANDGKSTEKVQVKTSDENKEAKVEKPVELKWYIFNSAGTKMRDEEIVWQEVNKYTEENLNIRVKPVILNGDDFKAKVPVAIASGEPYDITFTCSWLNDFLGNVSKGAFLPLNDLIDANGKEMYDAIPEVLWKAVTIEGNIYAVPVHKEIGHQFGFIYNAEMAQKHNLDMDSIKSFHDIIPMLRTIKEKEPGILPLDGLSSSVGTLPINRLTGDWTMPIVLNADESNKFTDVAQGQTYNLYGTEEYKEFVNMNHQMFVEGLVPQDPKYDATNDWKTQKVFAKCLWMAPNHEVTLTNNRGYEHGYVPAMKTIVETSDCYGALNAVSKKSKHPKEAVKFLNAVNTDQKLATMIRHGIPGKHYTDVNDNQIDFGPDNDPKDPVYDFSLGWAFGRIFAAKLPKSFPENTYAAYDNYSKDSVSAPALGFTFDTSNVQTELAAIKNVIAEYQEALTCGLVEPEQYIKEFNEKLEAVGLEKYQQEVQSQYDAWRK